ncbi:formimidoylglutamate deiminase [Vibrio mangrovi]|uniref:8-oxoguanine deaminase n=1 Tax=Vibrio mangrovi TaxID=474394 RepID=A0A1Y6IPV2_9VIBR|nr:formimidoylglutamate deiminase [Vibrio mangrovi]MDW6003530.1 formimidoylglutamate deiminase [Vibrio mangrovi]SMR99677.1 8-oxoguanine deaminase [Vibrio mangrovi]
MTDKEANTVIFAERACLPTGWQHNVVLEIINGEFTRVSANAEPPGGALHMQGPVLPTMVNVHSHAFQRVMAGMAEVSLNPDDSFWSWRDLMYKIVSRLSPQQVNIIATQLYIDMLKAGYTQVGEFHYLHHDPSGKPYADPAEMSYQLLDAAERSGIGMTLLPVLYRYAGFGAQTPDSGQARFIHSSESYLKLQHQLTHTMRDHSRHHLGICFHSLRAVSPQQIQEVLAELDAGQPIHIHIAEQHKEVSDCVHWSGQRPVEWLDSHIGLNERWCLIHATHLDGGEIHRIANSGAVVGLCPSTEANLGDGIFPGVDFTRAGGRWGIGSDSHVSLSIVDELRLLEYSQRLRDQQRNRLYSDSQNSVGDYLYAQALSGGSQACGVKLGLTAGCRADFMVLDSNHPLLMASQAPDIINRWLFACNENLIKDVFVAGKQCIKDGHHELEDRSRQQFADVIKQVIYHA